MTQHSEFVGWEPTQQFGSLLDMVELRASSHADKVLFHFNGGPDLTYGALSGRVSRYGAFLQDRGVGPGERVCILMTTSEQFLFAFFGVLAAGGIPVPLAPPVGMRGLKAYIKRQVRLLGHCGAHRLVTNRRLRKVAGFIVDMAPGKTTILDCADADAHGGSLARLPRIDPDETAFIQYTSGSTGSPKGVVLQHRNLLANIEAVGTLLEATEDDVGATWLPLHHDMGLIGMVLTTIAYGASSAIISPLEFLMDPRRWLEAISSRGATTAGAPNFAYNYIIRRLAKAPRSVEELDLSSWRVALNGAEPISARVMQDFASYCGPAGFRYTSFMPVYGLAENCLAVTGSVMGREPRVDRIDRAALSSAGIAEPLAVCSERAMDLVSVGRPVKATEVLIVNEAGEALPERTEGEIVVSGASTMKGYFDDPEETARTLRGGVLHTGDLGYLAEGNLYVTGRKKDLIILNGVNHYPQDIEATAGDIARVRPGCVAAFGVYEDSTGTEDLVVVAESACEDAAAREEIVKALRKAVSAAIGRAPDDVVIVSPGSVPKTTSGKLRRSECRCMYLEGDLGTSTSVVGEVVSAFALRLKHRVAKTLRVA